MTDAIERFSAWFSGKFNDLLEPPAKFLEHYVWGWPSDPWPPIIVIVLIGAGVYVTLRLGFVQIRGFRHAVDITRGKYDNPEDKGDLVHFQALTTALSATVGIGNIAGVAIAIRMGGPGALLWMWVTAFFGMALKYAECTLALRHRKVHPDGSASGGPMYYIEMGLGPSWKWMAIFFAACAAIASFGGGCMNQSNTLADQVRAEFGIPTIYSAIVFAAIVAAVIIGGIRRIGKVTAIMAPSMALLYVSGALLILILNIDQIIPGLMLIVTQAFAPESVAGGAVGSVFMTMLWGIRRGLFSNEAGQGSAPIAHAAAKTEEPVREGLVASLGPFIDTLVICTMTGLVIVMTGAYKEKVPQTIDIASVEVVRTGPASPNLIVQDGVPQGVELHFNRAPIDNPRFLDANERPWTGQLGVDSAMGITAGSNLSLPELEGAALLNGAPLTAYGFRSGLGRFGNLIVTLAVVLFAVSTGISWSYYGDRSVEYLFGAGAIPIYRWIFVFFFFLGGILPLNAVWTFGDVALGLMSFPNLIALILLTGPVVKMTRDYMSREHKPYR